MLRRFLAAVVVLAAATLVAPDAPRVAAADDGLDFANTTTYTVDPTSGVVHVRADLTLRNTLRDKVEGGIVTRRYFNGVTLPAPADARGAKATTASGRSLTINRRALSSENFIAYDIDFPGRLFYNQTQRVVVTYDITGFAPRSKNPSRVNAAYAAFDAFGVGDANKVTVKVVVPQGFVVDSFGDAVVTHDGGRTIYTAANIPDPDSFDLFISARNDDALTSAPLSSGDAEFDLRAWPGDDEWAAFVQQHIEDGVPELQELIGRPWPIKGSIEVREAYTPYLYGYAGWFSATDNVLEVGEDLDEITVLHELSHAWFNEKWFVERWLSEGFAQVYSNLAVEELGGDPETATKVATGSKGHVQLNDWSDPNFVSGADEVEAYGYDASFYVVQRIYDEIGADGMTDVLTAVDEGVTAYPGEDPDEKGKNTADWRRFLDLVERVGGAEDARALFEEYVVDTGQKALLDDRATAVEQYDALVEHGGEWAAPLTIRQDMANWAFPAAAKEMDAADDVLDLRDDLDERAATLGAEYPDHFETDYQAVTRDFDEVTAGLTAQIEAADDLITTRAAQAEEKGFFERIGLWGTTLPAQLDDATTAFEQGDTDAVHTATDRVNAVLAKAGDVGTTRFLWAVGGLVLFLLLVLVVVLLIRRRRRRRRAAAAAMAEAAAAAEAIALIGLDETPDAPGSEAAEGDDAADADGTEADDAGHAEWERPAPGLAESGDDDHAAAD